MESTAVLKKSSFLQGIVAGLSIAIGYIPAAIAFGFLAKGTGLTLFEAVAMSMFVYAGAAQYMALNLIALQTGAMEMIITTFIVNIRHLLMSATVRGKVEDDHPLIKALYSFGITDEVFAVTTTREGKVNSKFMFGVAFIAYASWNINTWIGYVAGSLLPASIQESMGIALYAMFIALLVPAAKKEKKVLLLATSAAVLNITLSFLLPGGWSIIFATLIAAIGVEAWTNKGGALR